MGKISIAIECAHETPEVLELWGRFEACCEFIKLDARDEAHEEFSGFEPLN